MKINNFELNITLINTPTHTTITILRRTLLLLHNRLHLS